MALQDGLALPYNMLIFFYIYGYPKKKKPEAACKPMKMINIRTKENLSVIVI